MNRSEELCKLLGIEPKCLDEEYSGCKYADDDSRQCCKKYNKNICEYSRFWIFPDLTKPSNFVKLLDLLNAYLDIRCDCLMAVVPQIIDKAIFLVSTNSDRFIGKKDKFKKQAQATKWEY